MLQPSAIKWSGHAQRLIRRLFYRERWMVGVIDQPLPALLKAKKRPVVRWIDASPNRSLACPFPWPGSADTFVCENTDLTAGKKDVTAIRIEGGGIGAEVPLALPLPEPLAFPFLFMREGVVYMLPDSRASGRLEILRWQEQEGLWAPHAVIYDDKKVANAVLFEKDGWFWISYTDLTKTPRENLHLIYSSRLTGPWKLHSANPVQIGLKACRNAGGVFKVGKKLYRPARDTSDRRDALRIMEIVMCTPLAYEEREAARLDPPDPAFPDGIRTLSPWGDFCLIDGKQQVLSLAGAWEKIKNKFSRATPQPAPPSS